MKRFTLVILFLVLILGRSVHADELVVAAPYLPDKIDLLSRDPVSCFIVGHIGAALITPEGDIGGLMKRMEQDATGKLWTITVQPGAYFISGSPVRAESVVAHLNQLPIWTSGFLQEAIGNIESAELSSEEGASNRTLRVRLRRADDSFFKVLALPLVDWRAIDFKSELLGQGTLLPTAGPFYVREHRPGLRTVLERVGKPERTITIRQFPDAMRAIGALRGGSVDVIIFPSRALLSEVKEDFTIDVNQLVCGGIPPFSSAGGNHWSSQPWARTRWESEERKGNEEIDENAVIKRRSLDLNRTGNNQLSLANAQYVSP